MTRSMGLFCTSGVLFCLTLFFWLGLVLVHLALVAMPGFYQSTHALWLLGQPDFRGGHHRSSVQVGPSAKCKVSWEVGW